MQERAVDPRHPAESDGKSGPRQCRPAGQGDRTGLFYRHERSGLPGKKQITFALQLYNMPPAAQIYVVVHEYCHFLQANHSPAFWAEVAKLLPDWKARRELLKK